MEIKHKNYKNDYFSVFYNGLDLTDMAMHEGIGKNPDGILSCTPLNTKKFYGNTGLNNPEAYSMFLNNMHGWINLLINNLQ